MFAVQSIPMAIKYYDIFQRLKTEGVHDLNVATILRIKPMKIHKKVKNRNIQEKFSTVL